MIEKFTFCIDRYNMKLICVRSILQKIFSLFKKKNWMKSTNINLILPIFVIIFKLKEKNWNKLNARPQGQFSLRCSRSGRRNSKWVICTATWVYNILSIFNILKWKIKQNFFNKFKLKQSIFYTVNLLWLSYFN